MADVLITLNRTPCTFPDASPAQWIEKVSEGKAFECQINGKKGTYCLVRKGQDSIASLGYVCDIDGESNQATLVRILDSFNETKIVELKQTLTGQFALLIKKGDFIYLFSDFMGARNIFYSDDGMIISTSFTAMEKSLGTSGRDIDGYKVLEFLAMRHVFYPTLLGKETVHKKIKWLLPYEYLVLDIKKSVLRLGSLEYSIDNKKQSDCAVLSAQLTTDLKSIINREEFKKSPVAVSLTGGRDSRLVAVLAAQNFRECRFRTAVSEKRPSSEKDLLVAKKIANLLKVPLDIYSFQHSRDATRFVELTEGFTPAFNHSITPILDNSGAYSLGLGGVYGSELFMPIPWPTIDAYIQAKVADARQSLKADEGFWNEFCERLYDDFGKIKTHYHLGSDRDERDYIRIFNLIDTVRYSSFILAAFNKNGLQFEPYGNYPIFELALRVSPALWGNHRKLGGDALVQKTAMVKLNPNVAKVMTYSSMRPMAPLTIASMPFYLLGFSLQVASWLKERFEGAKNKPLCTNLPGGYYLSDAWEKLFIDRTLKKYGLNVES